MKKIKFVTIILLQFFVIPLFAQYGYLDSSFHTDGINTISIGTFNIDNQNKKKSIAIQPDGKIIMAGSSFNGANFDFAITRFLQNGNLDSSFSDDGVLTTDIGGGNDNGGSVAIQLDGKIVVTGRSNNEYAIVRYLQNGILDSSFSNDGMLTTEIEGSASTDNSIVIQPDGKIIIAGTSFTMIGHGDFALARFLAAGSLDSNFSSDGKLKTDINSFSYDIGYSVAIQPDGKIVMVGTTYNGSDHDIAVVRYLPDGNLDNSFNGNGKLTTDLSILAEDVATSVAIQSDGKIVVAGWTSPPSSNASISLVRYLPDGNLDNSFSNDGKISTSVLNGFDCIANSIAIQSDGKIVVAGHGGSSMSLNFTIVRYLSDGSLDNSFSDDGKLMTDINSGIDKGYSIAIQPYDKIIVAGGSDHNLAIVRYISGLSLGTLDFSSSIEQALIYPNPITNNTKLSYNLTNTENISIYLLDMTGRKIKTYLENKQQIAGSYEQAISLPENLPVGTYLLVVSSEKGKVTVKVMKD